MKALAKWEAIHLVESLEAFIRAVVADTNSPHVEDAVTVFRQRDALAEQIFEYFGDGEDD